MSYGLNARKYTPEEKQVIHALFELCKTDKVYQAKGILLDLPAELYDVMVYKASKQYYGVEACIFEYIEQMCNKTILKEGSKEICGTEYLEISNLIPID